MITPLYIFAIVCGLLAGLSIGFVCGEHKAYRDELLLTARHIEGIRGTIELLKQQNETLLKLRQPDNIRIPTCWTEGTNKVPDCGTVTAASTKPTDSDRVLTPKKEEAMRTREFIRNNKWALAFFIWLLALFVALAALASCYGG